MRNVIPVVRNVFTVLRNVITVFQGVIQDQWSQAIYFQGTVARFVLSKFHFEQVSELNIRDLLIKRSLAVLSKPSVITETSNVFTETSTVIPVLATVITVLATVITVSYITGLRKISRRNIT